MEKYKNDLEFEDKVIADQVADEILTVDDNRDLSFFLLILVFLICLIFLVASLSFAIFNTYYNGKSTNIIDVGTDIVVNHPAPKPDDDDTPGGNGGNTKPSHGIDAGSILFSFNEKSNSIYMTNVYPTADAVGMKYTGDKQYFDFNISATLKNIKKGKIVYEISLIPIAGNTIDPKDIRVYLTEDGKDVSITGNAVNTYSDLPNSKYRTDGKVIYRKTITKNTLNEYIFRMWLSHDATVGKVSKQFGCKIGVDAYYK